MEASAPQAVVSVHSVEEITGPVYNKVHHDQIFAGEVTENLIGNFLTVQELVIVLDIPPVAERIQEQVVETIDLTPHCSQMALNTCSTTTSTDRRLN